MKISTSTSVAIVSGFFIFAGLCACVYMVYVTARTGNELTARAQAIADNDEKMRSLKSMKETFERSKEERVGLSSFALTEDEVGDFLTEIERLGSGLGVAITTGALKVEKKKDTPDQLSVEFAVEGDAQNVRTVLQLFETLPYPSILSGLTLVEPEGKEARGAVKVLITLVKYDR